MQEENSKTGPFRLSKEGQNYLETGLPEMNLVNILKEGPLEIQKAKEMVGNFNIAFQWTKKNGWVVEKDGMLRLVKEPKRSEIQEALKKIADGEEVEKGIIDVLIQRKLVKKMIRGEVDGLVGKEVSDLTPDLIKTGLWKKGHIQTL